MMVEVENIGKEYRLGENFDTYSTIRESIVSAFSKTTRRWRNLTTTSESNEQVGDVLWALKDVSFSVNSGEVIGVVGRNGAGKSTLLKVLTRITEPTEGRAIIRGRLGSLLEVGTGFHPEMTGRENVFLNGAILGMSGAEIRRKFDEIVEFAGVERFLDTAVKRYSSGMYVRLAFAVAAHLEPEVLIVDEVLAVGDAAFQKKCLGKLQEVGRSGRTVIFVSHNMAAVRSLCTRAILLEEGQVVTDGRPEEVIDRYLSKEETNGGVTDIPEDVERITNGQARHRSVSVTTRQGELVPQFYFGQPFRVCFETEIFERVTEAHFEVSICAMDGTHILYSTTMKQNPSLILDPGCYRVCAEFDTTLLPRTYTVELGVHRNDGETLDFVPRSCFFEVLRVAQGDEENYPWRAVRGHVRATAKWNYQLNAAVS